MEGYPALAEVMSLNDGLDIFRRFSTLNALNLLYMQAELVDLEYDLKDIAAEDCSADAATPKNEGRDSYHVSARALRESGRRGDDLQWAKVLEARNLLKEYNSSLLQYSSLRKLQPANKNDLTHLREWLSRPKHGNGFLARDTEGDPWLLSACEPDLIACTSRHEDSDGITKCVTDCVVPWMAKYLYTPSAQTDKPDLIFFSNARLEYAINISSSVLSSVLPTASIFVLYYIRSLSLRLGMIMLFTTVFAVALAVMVKARRVEVFAATTAFAAVQVVFVGSTHANGN